MFERMREEVARLPNLNSLQRHFILECLAADMGTANTADQFLMFFRFYVKDSGLSDKEIRDSLKIRAENMKGTIKEEINEVRKSSSGDFDPYFHIELLATLNQNELEKALKENDTPHIFKHAQELQRLLALWQSSNKNEQSFDKSDFNLRAKVSNRSVLSKPPAPNRIRGEEEDITEVDILDDTSKQK